MAVIDLEKCVTYGKLKAVRQEKTVSGSQTFILTGNAEVSFVWPEYTKITNLSSIFLNVDNGTEIHLVNKSFASSITLRIRVQNQNYYSYTMQNGGDGFESHAIIYANDNSLVTLQEWRAESDFWYGAYIRQSGDASSVTAIRYKKIYLRHSVDYDTTLTVYPGQEIWVFHNSSNARIINCIPATDYFVSGTKSSQIILPPGYRGVCVATVNKIDWIFSGPS